MSAAVSAPPTRNARRPQRVRADVPASATGELARREQALTLEDALARAWEDLTARGRTNCLVCGGSLQAAGAGGSCADCGAWLG